MVYGGDSVDEAVLTWANNKTSGNFTAAKNKIVDFGKANNRRVCYIFEVNKDALSETTEVVRKIMEKASEPVVKLDVPLVVDAGFGSNWADAH